MNTLLAVDGSDNSYEAVRALKYFRRADELLVLHVLDVPRPAYPMMVPEVAQELYTTMERNMREDGQRLLERIVSLLPMGIGPVATLLEVASPVDVIVTIAKKRKMDMIAIGARGLGPVKERLLGSVSHRVLTQAPCAKFIVPMPMKELRRILLPLEGSYDAEQAIRFLRLKPFREPVEIMILTVLPQTMPPWPVDAGTAAQLQAPAIHSVQDFVDNVASQLQASAYAASGCAVLGTPVESILHESAKLNPDLVLMGSHRRRGLARLALGSVSHAVLHKTTSPILVFN